MLRGCCRLGHTADHGNRLPRAKFACETVAPGGGGRQANAVDSNAVLDWAAVQVLAIGVMIALLALQATLEYRCLVEHRREFQAALERFDKKAERREWDFQAGLERSDRAFETATAQANALAMELAGIAQRTAHNEGTLETITGGAPRTESKSSSAADEPRTVAAQDVPGQPPAE